MWTIISAIFVIIASIFWALFSVGTNSHIRAEAQENPESWMYLYITLFDMVLKATVFRSAQHASATGQASTSEINIESKEDADKILAHEQVLTAEYAVHLFINPKLRIPKHVWFIARPETMFVTSVVFVFFVSLAIKTLSGQYFLYEIASIFFAMMMFFWADIIFDCVDDDAMGTIQSSNET